MYMDVHVYKYSYKISPNKRYILYTHMYDFRFQSDRFVELSQRILFGDLTITRRKNRDNRCLDISTCVIFTHVDAVRSLNSFDPGIFANLVLASFFRKIIAKRAKSVSQPQQERLLAVVGGPLTRTFSRQPFVFFNIFLLVALEM